MVDPRATIRESLAQLESAVEELALLAESTANDAVRLGAIKSRVEVLLRIHEFLQLTGVLPLKAEVLRHQIRMQDMGELLYGLWERHVPEERLDEARGELMAALEPIVRLHAADGVVP